ncbi:hypothetical protein ACFQ1E_06125 [Sphingomonas canadensis]|uniref:Uncharacterized protein n=1 Tax=Sphingomonas canadensis TaxID=1219257 RepID=A0ABW3H5G7_9SPHN|nr:hypothetical protein [Sphingomonas canadensis]MCW3835633.1 hypothetical protein [Sphingomonas canadensis]
MDRTNLSRRGLIGGTVALGAATLVPLSAAAAERPAPLLHADGVHDDTEALQALFDGRPVRVAREGVVARNEGGNVRLLNGNFRVSRELAVRDSVDLYSANCSFRLRQGPALPYPMVRNIL